ncbi:MAG: GTPase, partial [Candidatus Woesearchaeota archaeon]
MKRELTLEEGIKESLRVIGSAKTHPILVAIYGWPNSGKSYLINKLAESAISTGLEAAKYTGAPRPCIFETIQESPESVKGLFLLHCGWDYISGINE